MTYLSTAEVADIKGCTLRYVQQLAKTGKLRCETIETAANNRLEYRVPLSALSEREQLAYENRQRRKLGLEPVPLPAKNVPKPDPRQVTLRDLDDNQRQNAALWCRIIQEWQQTREQKGAELGGKCKADELYCAAVKLRYPELNISTDILYRKYKAYKAGDLGGLIDHRGGHNKGKTSIPQYMLDAFYSFYLHDNQLPVSRCYSLLQSWVQDFYPEAYADMPSERTFRRKAEELPYALVMYMRFGDKAFSDNCLPYIERLYDDLHANDVWIADNHTFDFFTQGENGKVHRLYLTAFTDAKSGVMVGWNLTENPSSDSTLLALRMGILRFGVPKSIYVDNGSEFLVSDIGGRGHRRRKDWNKDPLPPTILDFLHIEMHNAIVRNAKAKPIERTFYTFKNHFSRAIETFCGGTVVERKESLKWILKQGKIPTDLQIKIALDKFIDGDYNVSPYGGKETRYKGMKRFEVWNESIKDTTFRKADEANLDMLLKRVSRPQKVGRNGVFVRFAGEKLWYYGKETILHIGEQVYVRYDPQDPRSVRIYSMENDKYLWTWELADELMIPYLTENQEQIADAERLIAENKRVIKQFAKGIMDAVDPDKQIDIFAEMVRKCSKGEQELNIVRPNSFVPVFSEEKLEEQPELSNIEQITLVLDQINMTASRRKGL